MEKTNQTTHETMQRNKISKHNIRNKYLDFVTKCFLTPAISAKKCDCNRTQTGM